MEQSTHDDPERSAPPGSQPGSARFRRATSVIANGGAARKKGAGTGLGWSPGGIRLFAAVLIAVQVIQGLNDPVTINNSAFTQSYYLITYHHGFVRRGLLGEGFRLLFGVPTRSEVDLAVGLVAVLVIGAVLVLIELLVRHGTAGSYSMAILLAASPFLIDFVIVDLRPDLLGLVVLVALGIVLTRSTHALRPWLAATGLAFGALVLVHEDVALIYLPWAIVLVAIATLGRDGVLVGPIGPVVIRQLVGRLAALVAPPVLATVAVLAYGLPSAHKVVELKSDVSTFPLRGGTMFIYLPDSIRTSIRLVESIPAGTKTHTLLVGCIIVVLQLAWILRWVRPRLWSPFATPGLRGLGLGLAAIISISTVILFATGIDWLRWFADCGAAWLIAQSFAVLLVGPAPGGADLGCPRPCPNENENEGEAAGLGSVPDRIRLSYWMPALALYLAAIPPLDVLTTAGQLRHFFFFM